MANGYWLTHSFYFTCEMWKKTEFNISFIRCTDSVQNEMKEEKYIPKDLRYKKMWRFRVIQLKVTEYWSFNAIQSSKRTKNKSIEHYLKHSILLFFSQTYTFSLPHVIRNMLIVVIQHKIENEITKKEKRKRKTESCFRFHDRDILFLLTCFFLLLRTNSIQKFIEFELVWKKGKKKKNKMTEHEAIESKHYKISHSISFWFFYSSLICYIQLE